MLYRFFDRATCARLDVVRRRVRQQRMRPNVQRFSVTLSQLYAQAQNHQPQHQFDQTLNLSMNQTATALKTPQNTTGPNKERLSSTTSAVSMPQPTSRSPFGSPDSFRSVPAKERKKENFLLRTQPYRTSAHHSRRTTSSSDPHTPAQWRDNSSSRLSRYAREGCVSSWGHCPQCPRTCLFRDMYSR